jgi:hypothetical protein
MFPTLICHSSRLSGRMASAATTLGVPAATAPLTDLSRNVVSMAGAFGGETGGPLTDGMQASSRPLRRHHVKLVHSQMIKPVGAQLSQLEAR